MLTQKKAYEKPELTRRGDIASVTQGNGSLGSGDLIYRITGGAVGKDGCDNDWTSPLCTYGS